MRKIYNILIVLVLLISISSIVLAKADDKGNHYGKDDDDQDGTDDLNENETKDDVDDKTKQEMEIMNNSLGAEIRLLQLQKAIFKNILKGEMAVNVLKGLNFNTTSLETTLAEMKALLEEVKEANTSSNESVIIFVELKIQAKNLTAQFRETIKELLDDVNLSEIRDQFRNMTNMTMSNEQFENLSKNIQNRIKQFNRNQLYRMYGIIGEADNTFVDEYMNGNFTLDQIRLHISKIINQMSKEKKFEIFSELKEDNIKGKIHAQAIIDEMENKGKGKGHGDDD